MSPLAAAPVQEQRARGGGTTPGNDCRLRESDLRALLDTVNVGYDDDPGEALPAAVLQGLATVIPGSSVSFLELDVSRRVVLTDQEFGCAPVPADLLDTLDRVFWGEYWNCLLCSYPDRTADLRSVIKMSQLNVLGAYKTIGPMNLPALYKSVWDYVPHPTVVGAATVSKEITTGTDPKSAALIKSVSDMITVNYKTILEKLVARGYLMKA